MIEINLFEEKKTIQAKVFENLKKVNWKLALFAVIFFKIPGIVVNIYFDNETSNIKEEKERISALVAQHEEYVEKNQEVKRQVKLINDRIIELKAKIEQIQRITKKKKNPFYPLESIIHIVPDYVWLTELVLKDNSEIRIKGMAREYKFVNSFRLNLNQSPFFENSFVIDNVKTVGNKTNTGSPVNSPNAPLRDESFSFVGKVVRFEL